MPTDMAPVPAPAPAPMAAYTVGVPSSVEPMAPPGPSAAAARSLGDGEVVESWNDPGASYGPMVLNHTKYIYIYVSRCLLSVEGSNGCFCG